MKPILVLKPSATEVVDGDIYAIRRNLFLPTPKSVEMLISALDEYDLGGKGVHPSVSKFYSRRYRFTQGTWGINNAERLAEEYSCTILGGTFLAFLISRGIHVGKTLGVAQVTENDLEYHTAVYPDLLDYFSGALVDDSRSEFCTGVICNNSGRYTVIGSQGSLRKLAYLKRVYRFLLKTHIEWPQCAVRDNAVHTPATPEELKLHTKLLTERFV